MLKLQRWLIFSIAFLCFAQVTLDPTSPEITEWLNVSSAQAKSRGGGFSSRSSSSSSRSSSSSKSFSSSSSSSSKGNTGGRTRGGSFNRQPQPTPVSPSSPTKTTTHPSSSPSAQPSSPSSYPVREYTPSRPIYINPEIEIEIEDDDDDDAPYPYSQQNPAPYVPGGTLVQPVTPKNDVAPSPTVVPNSTIPTATKNNGFPGKFIFFLLLVGGGLFLAWYLLSKRSQLSSSGRSSELTNDTVTVTKLQVALLAEARDIQSQLTDLSVQADLDTPEGLSDFLQETSLALLRNPQYWSHAQSSSQTLPSRDEARQMFEQLSIAERCKFGVETLSRINDRLQQGSMSIDPEQDPAEYIVVTLLVGTEDDRPLFEQIYAAEDLQQALKTLAAISPYSLAIFELLWSPQVSTDSLSYDELLTQYPELIPLG